MSAMATRAPYAPRIPSPLNPTPRTSPPSPDNAIRRRRSRNVSTSVGEDLMRYKAALAYLKSKPDHKVGVEDGGGEDKHGAPPPGPPEDLLLGAEGGGSNPMEDGPDSRVSDGGQIVDDSPYSAEGGEVVGDGLDTGSVLSLMVEEWDNDKETQDTPRHAGTDGAEGIFSGDFTQVELDDPPATEATEPIPRLRTLRRSGPSISNRDMWTGARAGSASAASSPERGPPQAYNGMATPILPLHVPDAGGYSETGSRGTPTQENIVYVVAMPIPPLRAPDRGMYPEAGPQGTSTHENMIYVVTAGIIFYFGFRFQWFW